MSETVLKIEGLSKDYKMFARKKDRIIETLFPGVERHGVFEAMHDFNLEVKKGEVLGVLGKNGAGKSTLLKMITGVVTPTKGTIEAKGKISSLLELGTAFNQELTGYENIYQHGQVMGLTNEEIKAREQEIIDFADIGDHLYQPVKTYSSGMFARLAFACAINVNPDILIVDEVLSVGDMSFQLKCFKKFEQFKESLSIAEKAGFDNINVIMSEGLVLQDVDVWYDSTKIHTTPHNNMTELYFEDNDIEGIIEKLESGKYVVSYVTDLMELECGQKLVRFYDPSGNLIEVRTPINYN